MQSSIQGAPEDGSPYPNLQTHVTEGSNLKLTTTLSNLETKQNLYDQ